jgi:hypothetical protein
VITIATATFKWYGAAATALAAAKIDWAADTINCSLHTSSYTPDQDAHNYADDLTNEVANSGNYTTGGKALTTKTLNYDAATNTLRLRADDIAWANSTIASARVAVLRKVRGGASSADELVGYAVFDSDVSSSAGTFTIDLDATAGVLQLVAS